MPAPALQTLIEDFQLSEGREKLELLVQAAETLPELPARYAGHANMHLVQECITPVYVQAETQAGRMCFFFDVPEKSPAVRGFVALLAQALHNASPQEVLQMPPDFLQQTGLNKVVTHQRLNGMAGVLLMLKRLAAQALDSTSN